MPILYNIADSITNSVKNKISNMARGLASQVKGAIGDAITELTGQSITAIAAFEGLPEKLDGASLRGYGIYTEDGGLLIDFTSFIRIEPDSTNQVTQAPVEAGSFVMYNKAVTPTVIDVLASYCCQDDAEMGQVEQALLDLSSATDLVNIVTPTIEYKGYNLESVKPSMPGQGMMLFDMSFVEVRQVTVQYSNAKLSKKKRGGKKSNGNESALHGIGEWLGL